jgi:hypothetical protein
MLLKSLRAIHEMLCCCIDAFFRQFKIRSYSLTIWRDRVELTIFFGTRVIPSVLQVQSVN